MKSDSWQQVRELIETARERRAENLLAVATKAGALIAEAIETRDRDGANPRRPHRLRLLIDIETDLVTGETSGAAEIVPALTSPSPESTATPTANTKAAPPKPRPERPPPPAT